MKTTESSKHILVVDDNEQALALVREALQTRGFKVTTLNRGEAVITTLESKKGGEYSMVILDLVMPDADGMEIAREILERHPAMRILIVSGYADDVVHGIFEKPNVDFLGKPFSIRDLFHRVNTLYAQA